MIIYEVRGIILILRAYCFILIKYVFDNPESVFRFIRGSAINGRTSSLKKCQCSARKLVFEADYWFSLPFFDEDSRPLWQKSFLLKT